MKHQDRIDELLMKLAEGTISESDDKKLLAHPDKALVGDYLAIIELEELLSNTDSALQANFEVDVLDGITQRTLEHQVLKNAFYSSFKNTFLGLVALILVIGPIDVLNFVAPNQGRSSNIALASSFQTKNIVGNLQSLSARDKNEVTVLIELVDGATKQKEFVTAVLKVDRKSPGLVSLMLPSYEAGVLKEFERRVEL